MAPGNLRLHSQAVARIAIPDRPCTLSTHESGRHQALDQFGDAVGLFIDNHVRGVRDDMDGGVRNLHSESASVHRRDDKSALCLSF